MKRDVALTGTAGGEKSYQFRGIGADTRRGTRFLNEGVEIEGLGKGEKKKKKKPKNTKKPP